MRYILTALALLIGILILFSGCISHQSQLHIEELTTKLNNLQGQVEDKIIKARTGELSVGEALEFIRHAETEIKSTRDELRRIKKRENIGWTELIGAVIVSLLGGNGIVRAWRGPTHKATLNLRSPDN